MSCEVESWLRIKGQTQNVQRFVNGFWVNDRLYVKTEEQKHRFCLNSYVPIPKEILKRGFDYPFSSFSEVEVFGYLRGSDWQRKYWGTKWAVVLDEEQVYERVQTQLQQTQPEAMCEVEIEFSSNWTSFHNWVMLVGLQFPNLTFVLDTYCRDAQEEERLVVKGDRAYYAFSDNFNHQAPCPFKELPSSVEDIETNPDLAIDFKPVKPCKIQDELNHPITKTIPYYPMYRLNYYPLGFRVKSFVIYHSFKLCRNPKQHLKTEWKRWHMRLRGETPSPYSY